jgi:hypothetical protein
VEGCARGFAPERPTSRRYALSDVNDAARIGVGEAGGNVSADPLFADDRTVPWSIGAYERD